MSTKNRRFETDYLGHKNTSREGQSSMMWSPSAWIMSLLGLQEPGRLDAAVEQTQEKKIEKEMERAWSFRSWMTTCIRVFLFGMLYSFVLIVSATIVADEPESTTWPLVTIGPTIAYGFFLWFAYGFPGANGDTIEMYILSIFMSWLFVPMDTSWGRRMEIGFKSTILNLSYTASLYGAWVLTVYLTSLFNGNNLADVAMPTQTIYAGFYGQMGNITLLIFISGCVCWYQIETLFVQRGVDTIRHRTASKVWYARGSEFHSKEEKFILMFSLVARFYLFMTFFMSPLDPGLLLSAPALSSADRVSISWYIGMSSAGYGAAIIVVWFMQILGFKSFSEEETQAEVVIEGIKGAGRA